MPSSSEKSDFLFKKSVGKGYSTDSKNFFNEPTDGRASVFFNQSLSYSKLIPFTAPLLNHLEEQEVLRRYVDHQLTQIPGVNNAFYSEALRYAIPFNYGDGTYNYELKDNSGNALSFGVKDWTVDPDVGVLVFHEGAPPNMPPKISFYKYIGPTDISHLPDLYVRDEGIIGIDNEVIFSVENDKVGIGNFDGDMLELLHVKNGNIRLDNGDLFVWGEIYQKRGNQFQPVLSAATQAVTKNSSFTPTIVDIGKTFELEDNNHITITLPTSSTYNGVNFYFHNISDSGSISLATSDGAVDLESSSTYFPNKFDWGRVYKSEANGNWYIMH